MPTALRLKKTNLYPQTIDYFRQRTREWKDDTANASHLEQIVSHPSYLKIIGMGRKIIPLILDDLLRGPAPWFPALEALCSFKPKLSEEEKDDFIKMKSEWLRFGLKKKMLEEYDTESGLPTEQLEAKRPAAGDKQPQA